MTYLSYLQKFLISLNLYFSRKTIINSKMNSINIIGALKSIFIETRKRKYEQCTVHVFVMFLSVFCNKVMQSMKPLHGWDPRGRVLFVASGALPSYTAYMTANKSHSVKQFSQAYPVKHIASSQSNDLSCSPTQPSWLLTQSVNSPLWIWVLLITELSCPSLVESEPTMH